MNIGQLSVITSLAILGPAAHAANQVTGNEFNPAISLILDGHFAELEHDEMTLPGFQLGGEAGLPANGFSLGHSELSLSANVDDRFYGLMNAAIVHEEGETSLELEEAYIETLGLGNGFNLKAGRFFSSIGYLNSIHDHAHDFTDRPLTYDALLGGHLADTGLQLNWVAPTDIYWVIGAEVLAGSEYPSGENENNNSGFALFMKFGGDISASSSWQLGISHYKASFDTREAGGHHHGDGEEVADNELMDGNVALTGVDLVYKWAPDGNMKERYFKLQAEYFLRAEKGDSSFVEEEGVEEATGDYDGKQTGFYIQAVYQFKPFWRVGLRYDQLMADNDIDDITLTGLSEDEYLEESGLRDEDDPHQHSIMIDYSPSHFSRIRLQFNQLDTGHDQDIDMVMLQYTMSLGSHGAHKF